MMAAVSESGTGRGRCTTPADVGEAHRLAGTPYRKGSVVPREKRLALQFPDALLQIGYVCRV